jgi:hypothetical protein
VVVIDHQNNIENVEDSNPNFLEEIELFKKERVREMHPY